MSLYVDTNIFIYSQDRQSEYYDVCQQFFARYTADISTSVETIQEIIHFSVNTKQRDKGILLAKAVPEICPQILSITTETVSLYLQKVQEHPTSTSRDVIHLASCLENDICTLVSYDKDFRKFTEIRVVTPEELLS